jgi:Arc/MetJ-type ribon-helix-helix transcriptional regulator
MMNEQQNEQQNAQQEGPLTSKPQPSGHRPSDTIEDIAATLRDLFSRVPEGVSRAVERAMNVRDTTVLLRLSESASDALDTLVSAGVFKSRSEAAAFLIDEGIKAQAPLFQRIQDKLSEIERLRDELRHTISPDIPQ